MIYNKPHDISWKLLPSFGILPDNKPKKKHTATAERTINQAKSQGVIIPQAPPYKNKIIDINDLPIIEGVPILQFPPKKQSSENESVIKKSGTSAQNEKSRKKNPINQPPKKGKSKPTAKQITDIKEKKKTFDKAQLKPQALRIASFFVLLYFGAILAFSIPLRPSYSESEKRDLAKFPEFSFDEFRSGEYFSDIDAWFSDTFPYRNFFTGIDGKLKELYGVKSVAIHGELDEGDEIPDAPVTQPKTTKPEEEGEEETKTPVTTEEQTTQPPKRPDIAMQDLGAVLVAGDSAYEYYGFHRELGTRYVNAVNSIKEKATPTDNAYAIVVPTSIDVTLNDVLRSEVKSSDQEKALKFFNSSITNAITTDNLLDIERQHRDEYIYFRTDHHWTALGAYYAYSEFCIKKGIAPVALSEYKTTEFDNFTGTFYTNASHSSTLEENSDTVVAYMPLYENICTITDTNGATYDLDLVRDVTDFGSTLKYLTFAGGDNPLTTIKNLEITNGKTCLVIKDSYGNAFVPFLLPHYETIYVIDPRYYQSSLSDFISDKTINDVIFISNISTTRNYIFIEALENLVR